MIIQPEFNLDKVWENTWESLSKGIATQGHPFKTPVFISFRKNYPIGRVVVLRDLDNDKQFWFYTDSRSEKVKYLERMPVGNFVFYDSASMVQIRIMAKISIHKEDEVAKQLWEAIPDNQRADYGGDFAPGVTLQGPEEQTHDGKMGYYFCALCCSPFEMEVLQLRPGEGHLKVRYEKSTTGWTQQWIAP
ncbi:MAG: pyridoxamine 5'-phosphate oxidase family protein [Saprospiraceae bacterium]|nr:pyridoxamine 5'-phosphate oxidase family protein [Saprospiraceae bacterium]